MKRRRAERAVLLVDHGSRERAANAQLDAVAAALARRLRGRLVRTAHLSLAAPTVGEAIDACVAAGASEIVVVPYFLAPGRHARRDVPALVREARGRHPRVKMRVTGPLGVHAGLVAVVAARVRERSGARRRRDAARAGSS